VTTAFLIAEHLLGDTLPEACGPVLDALAELDDLTNDRHAARAARCDAAQAVYRRLMDHAGALVEPTPDEFGVDQQDYRRWFTEAVVLWTRLAETSSPPLVDTVGTSTLREYPLDLPMDAEAAARVRAALLPAFRWSSEELQRIDREMNHLTSNLPLKQALTKALAQWLDEAGGPSPERRATLMRDLYGRLPWRPGDVDLVMTATGIFLCVPKRGAKLEVAGYGDRPADERRAIEQFLETLMAANNAETKRFPAFGLFEAQRVDDRLLDTLAQRSGAPRRAVLETLSTMVMVLPTRLVDQYLVHDAWGHTWQEALVEFEHEFALLPKLDDPLTPESGPELAGEGGTELAAAFVARGGRTELDEAVLLRATEADLRGRVQVAVSAALAEMLADFMESKYARAHPDRPLPTSSLLPATAVKLDLTLSDVRRQVVRWTRPYRTLAVDAAARAALARGLSARGLPEAGLLDAVEQGARAIWHALLPAFDETLRAEPAAQGCLRSSVLRRLMLQFVLLDAEFERALRWPASAAVPWTDPGACADLFAITVARLYEQDRQKNFWHLDQVMRTEFRAGCAQLRDALAAP
jgi:hypothetical protein